MLELCHIIIYALESASLHQSTCISVCMCYWYFLKGYNIPWIYIIIYLCFNILFNNLYVGRLNLMPCHLICNSLMGIGQTCIGKGWSTVGSHWVPFKNMENLIPLLPQEVVWHLGNCSNATLGGCINLILLLQLSIVTGSENLAKEDQVMAELIPNTTLQHTDNNNVGGQLTDTMYNNLYVTGGKTNNKIYNYIETGLGLTLLQNWLENITLCKNKDQALEMCLEWPIAYWIQEKIFFCKLDFIANQNHNLTKLKAYLQIGLSLSILIVEEIWTVMLPFKTSSSSRMKQKKQSQIKLIPVSSSEKILQKIKSVFHVKLYNFSPLAQMQKVTIKGYSAQMANCFAVTISLINTGVLVFFCLPG